MTCVIPASATPPFASRINSLHTRERAWRHFNWRSKHRLNIPPSGPIYDFAGGLYATGEEDGDRLTRSISFWELPTSGDTNGEAGLQSWTHLMEGITIIDFTMDPAQDLLVLVTLAPANSLFLYEIHLRSIATNETHPKALMPELCCLSGSEPHPATLGHPASVRIQISGDLIALLVKEASSNLSSHLEIWDWVNNPEASLKIKSGIEDFTFLSNDAFLIARTTGSLETYTFPSPITDSSTPVSQYNYMFPQISAGYMYWYMSISSNPASASTPRAYPHRSRGKQLYSPKPEERIYMCSLCVFDSAADDEQRMHCFNFFFNAQSLLHPLDEWKAAARKANKGRVHRCVYPHTSPSISAQPLSSMTSPTSHPTDLSYQPRHILARPPSPSTATSSSAPSSSSSTRSTTMSAPSLSSRAHTRPVLRRPKLPKAAQPVRVPLIIPWHVWGPQSTRWFEDHGNTDWQHSVYGLRTIDSVKVDCSPTSLSRRDWNAEAGGPTSAMTYGGQQEGNNIFDDFRDIDIDEQEPAVPPRFLRLRDYNPYSIRECLQIEEAERLQGRNGNKWFGPRVVTHPTTTDGKGVFIHDIVSRLPYVEVLSKETFRVTDVMMDGCRVLLHKV
ncbi:hypothetical protein C0993_010561 [Termitomyces sp. T159_Od127]|nr:hypothetical protein C0993_010561 [Termitomyces sp. T159_Od127]